MRLQPFVSIGLIGLSLHAPAFAQEASPREILAEAERVYPDSQAPTLFGPGSASLAFADEVEDRVWSSDMEARILEAVEREREQGLILRRAEVECRTSTCAVLLIHAANRSRGSVQNLSNAFRETLGFAAASLTEKQIPMTIGARDASGTIRTWFMSAHVEFLLTGALRNEPAAD